MDQYKMTTVSDKSNKRTRGKLDDLITRLNSDTIQRLLLVLKEHSIVEIIDSLNESLKNPAKRPNLDTSASLEPILNDLKTSMADISSRLNGLERKMCVSTVDDKPITLNDGQAVSTTAANTSQIVNTTIDDLCLQAPSNQAAAEVQSQVQAQQVQAQQQQIVGEQVIVKQQQLVLAEPHLQPQQHQIVYAQRMQSSHATIRYQSIQTPIQSPLQRQCVSILASHSARPKPKRRRNKKRRQIEKPSQQLATTPNLQIGPGQQTELKPVDAAKVTIRRQIQRSGDPNDIEESKEETTEVTSGEQSELPPPPPSQAPSRQENERELASSKILVILQSGEQRLISYTLPNESCTVQELLAQVGIHLTADSNIQWISNSGADIDYVVALGMPNADSTELLTAAMNALKSRQAAQQAAAAQQTTEQQTSKQEQPPKGPKYVPFKTPFTGDNKMVPTSSQQQPVMPDVLKNKATDQLNNASLELKRQQVAEMVTKGIVGVAVNTNKGRGRSTFGTGTRGVVLELCSNDSSKNENGDAVKKTPSPTEVKSPLKFEPLVTEEMKAAEDLVRDDVTCSTQMLAFKCRTIQIGSHKYVPTEKVVITTKGVRIVAPNVKRSNEKVVLNIQASELVRLIYHFSKPISVIFLCTMPSCGAYVRESLEMGLLSDQLPYYNPSKLFKEHFRRIVLVLDTAPDDKERRLKEMIRKEKLEEIKLTDAEELLMSSVPRADA